MSPRTTTVTVSVRPSSEGDFFQLQNGRAISLEQPGRLISPGTMTLRGASAVTVDVIVGLP